MQSSDFASGAAPTSTQMLVLPPPPRYTLTPQESTVPVSINTPSKKISSIPKGLLWGIIIFTVVIGLGWIIFFAYIFWKQKYFFAYERPSTLPGQEGAPIVPTAKGYPIPDPLPAQGLKNTVILLGGPVSDRSEADGKATQEAADKEIGNWNDWNAANAASPPVSSLAARP